MAVPVAGTAARPVTAQAGNKNGTWVQLPPAATEDTARMQQNFSRRICRLFRREFLFFLLSLLRLVLLRCCRRGCHRDLVFALFRVFFIFLVAAAAACAFITRRGRGRGGGGGGRDHLVILALLLFPPVPLLFLPSSFLLSAFPGCLSLCATLPLLFAPCL